MLVVRSVHHPTARLETETTTVCPSSKGHDMDLTTPLNSKTEFPKIRLKFPYPIFHIPCWLLTANHNSFLKLTYNVTKKLACIVNFPIFNSQERLSPYYPPMMVPSGRPSTLSIGSPAVGIKPLTPNLSSPSWESNP